MRMLQFSSFLGFGCRAAMGCTANRDRPSGIAYSTEMAGHLGLESLYWPTGLARPNFLLPLHHDAQMKARGDSEEIWFFKRRR